MTVSQNVGLTAEYRKTCLETQTNDTFSLFKTVTSWDYLWIAMIRDKNALQLEKNEGMGNGPTADGYMRSFWKKLSHSLLN